MAKTDYYYRFAVGSCVLSALTTVSILIVVPLLCSRASWGRDQISSKSERFRNDANRLWYQMHNGGEVPDYQVDNTQAATFFSRPKRSPWDRHVCSECNQLSCPVGMPGPPGESGTDGQPGNSGASGKAGDDGYDVELEPQDDLPCVICPAGPPGLRGMQGERGTSGQQGARGNQGNDGKFGTPGPRGVPGRSGPIGQKGAVGPQGPPGETTVAGVGIKGPNGPPGAIGPKGPIGRPGKSSREAGPIGPPGPPGPQGNPGAIGRQGDDGNFGAPGEHGEPSTYCHSDCGVSQILAPSVSEMMSHDIHSMGDGSAGYTNTEAKQTEVSASYNHDVQPVHSVGINDAYSGYMNPGAAVQVQ